MVVLETEFRGHRFWPAQAEGDWLTNGLPTTPGPQALFMIPPQGIGPQAGLGPEPLACIHHQSSELPISLSKALWAEHLGQG